VSRWPRVPLGEVVELVYGRGLPQRARRPGSVPVYGSNGVTGYHSNALAQNPTIIVGRKGSAGSVHLVHEPSYPIDTTYYVVPRGHIPIDLDYLFLELQRVDLSKLRIITGVPGLNREDAYQQPIVVPPLDEQRHIVDLLSHANSIRRLRREALTKARTLIPAVFHEMFGDEADLRRWGAAPLEDVAGIASGVTKGRRFKNGEPIEVPYLRVANVQAGWLDLRDIKTIRALPSDVERLRLRAGDVLLTEGGDFDKLGRGALLAGCGSSALAAPFFFPGVVK
jgi:type I restriction enzyme, S subunit